MSTIVLLTDSRFSPPIPVSLGDGASVWGTPAVLDSDVYRDTRWCVNCGGKQVFVEVYEFEAGRLGVCLGCGEEKVVLFTRVTE